MIFCFIYAVYFKTQEQATQAPIFSDFVGLESEEVAIVENEPKLLTGKIKLD